MSLQILGIEQEVGHHSYNTFLCVILSIPRGIFTLEKARERSNVLHNLDGCRPCAGLAFIALDPTSSTIGPACYLAATSKRGERNT